MNNLNYFKKVIIIILQMMLTGVIYYIIFQFVLNDMDVTTWHWSARLLYLLLIVGHTSTFTQKYLKNQ